MDKSVINTLEQIKLCIRQNRSFVLQGGAGSGKTESLKRVVQFCTEKYPNKRIICITHTNKAVEEIISRVGNNCDVSTIHSFLNKLISPYSKTLLKMLPDLFCLPLFQRIGIEQYQNDVKIQNAGEHARFKKSHESLENKRITVLGEGTNKVVGKREYDKNPDIYNLALNEQIEKLNIVIRDSLEQHHYKDVHYNDTPFENFKNASYGHDGLIKLTSLLFEHYPNFGKIVCDKYDCIFIDEYQDTDESIIRGLIYKAPSNKKTVIGLFGDSEQAIYEGGIGSAIEIVNDKKLELIEKLDNYRCSPQVIKFANKFRSDGLRQEVALKEVDGVIEKLEDRDGMAKLLYAKQLASTEKPAALKSNATPAQVEEHRKNLEIYDASLLVVNAENNRRLEALISSAKAEMNDAVILKLPNRFVARDAGFGNLYDLFDQRFRSAREEIKKHLDRLQFGQLADLLLLFEYSVQDKRATNKLISKIRDQGLFFKTLDDKRKLYETLSNLLNSDESAYEALTSAFRGEIISVSESHKSYLRRKAIDVERIEKEANLKAFKDLLTKGCNTELRMIKHINDNKTSKISEDIVKAEFDLRMRDIRIEKFYNGLFGSDLKFKEIIAFYKYENDGSGCMTMHKTKGTGIENVLVVLDEFDWSKYDFQSCFSETDDNPSRQALTRKLLYVACSRAKKGLICVRLVKNEDEIKRMQEYFDESIEVAVC